MLMRTTLLSTALLLTVVFGYGQLKLPKIKKNNRFKIEQKKEVATDTTNSFKIPKQKQKQAVKTTMTADDYYRKAQQKSGHLAVTQINKAIAIDSTNLAYRKLRAQKLMIDGAQQKELLLAIDDLTFVANNGGEHYRVFWGIVTCYKELAGATLSFKRPKTKKDPFGDNTAYNNEYKAIYQARIEYYNKALDALKKAEQLGADTQSVAYKRKDIHEGIAKLKSEVEMLKD